MRVDHFAIIDYAGFQHMVDAVGGIDVQGGHLDGPAALGFLYVTVIATALAFAAWFAGLRHLDAGTVGLVGLLNPVTGVLLGTLLAGELLTWRQLLGMALVLGAILFGRAAPRARRTRRPRVGRRVVRA